MNEMKIEWTYSLYLDETDGGMKSSIPVVRLAAVDQVIAEAVKIMNVCMAVGEIHFKTCVLAAGAHDRLNSFLTSDLVAQWRKRREGKP